MSFSRYAIYAAPPPDSALWKTACSWLGRNPERPGPVKPQRIDGLAPEAQAEITAEARRYGFHGTLKPPFALATRTDPARLESALAGFVADRPAPAPLRLVVASISDFLALVPAEPVPGLNALADACVAAFDRFRQPPTDDELARRRQATLKPAQIAYLERWGYPYVFGEFRFHMTLTRRLEATEAAVLLPGLQTLFAPLLADPLPITDLALFAEPEPGTPFRLLRRFPFAG